MDCPQEFKQMMMLDNDSDADESLEKIPESFICCVCRDLLYKPVVLACGHVSCFWCVHHAMNYKDLSSCPICRSRYHHFPYVCQKLHFLILKLYPNAYKKREKEILGEEQESGTFSPELDAATAAATATGVSASSSSDANVVDCNKVSVGDVLCGSCKHMLYRPVVLNCGHVFCAGCIVSRENEVLRCEVCEYPQPTRDFPKMCFVFDHFLEEQFPTEYKQRSVDSLMKQKEMSNETQKETSSETPGTSSSSAGNQGSPSKYTFQLVHRGVGCDSCGMYPIIGDRYKCKNCVVQIGYDLCKDCYTNLSICPGRFNQHHTSDHEFEVINQQLTDFLEILREHRSNISAIVASMRDQNVDLLAFDEINEEGNNEEEDAPLPSLQREENQSDNQQPEERLL